MLKIVKVVCNNIDCGKPFEVTQGRYNDRLKRNPNHKFYCTNECKYKGSIIQILAVCNNPDCKKEFYRQKARSEGNIYCSQSCSALVNNGMRPVYAPCPVCQKPVNTNLKVCCSHKCVHEKNYLDYIRDWKAGLEDGMSGKAGVSPFIRRYLFEKFNSKCRNCGWCAVHPNTGKIPLQVDHIDGNWRNNVESNLDLLCPNCHSLTPTFGSLNTGNGRRTNGGWY